MKYLRGTSVLMALIALSTPTHLLASAQHTAEPYLETLDPEIEEVRDSRNALPCIDSGPEGFVPFPIPRQAEAFIFAELAQEACNLVDCENTTLYPEGQTCKYVDDGGFRVTIYKKRPKKLPSIYEPYHTKVQENVLHQALIFSDHENGVDGVRFTFTFHSFTEDHALSVEQFLPNLNMDCVKATHKCWQQTLVNSAEGSTTVALSCLALGKTDFAHIFIRRESLVKAAGKS